MKAAAAKPPIRATPSWCCCSTRSATQTPARPAANASAQRTRALGATEVSSSGITSALAIRPASTILRIDVSDSNEKPIVSAIR